MGNSSVKYGHLNRMEVNNYAVGAFLMVAFLTSVLNTVIITRNADYATEKYYRVAATGTYLVCIALYIVLYFYFQQHPEYQVSILIGILMLVCLPATLVSVSSAFLIGGNL